MRIFETHPIFPEERVGGSNEVFRHRIFADGSEPERRRIMFESSNIKYESEMEYPWDHYFGKSLLPLLKCKVALDLGCFTGGRTIGWAQRYKLAKVYGIDIKQTYIDAATQYAHTKGVQAEFRLAKGESLPFEDGMFDAVLSFDVFEHVTDIEKTLSECSRVLRERGCLFVVFPSYYHPIEHHLSLVTMTLWIHCFFEGSTLIKAYNEMLEERGNPAYWYKRINPDLESWERCNTINGTALAKFRSLASKGKWKVISQSKLPILSVGRNISKKPILRTLGLIISPIADIPVLEEFFSQRITYILQKC
jgi:ubiquinone/menaquinone biosynthesis C-methylase UbiE